MSQTSVSELSSFSCPQLLKMHILRQVSLHFVPQKWDSQPIAADSTPTQRRRSHQKDLGESENENAFVFSLSAGSLCSPEVTAHVVRGSRKDCSKWHR